MIIRLVVAFVLSSFLLGCGTVKTMSREEWEQETVRTFSDKSPEEILKASEELFRLSDANDFTFAYPENELLARRSWMVFAVLANASGEDIWRVTAERTANGKTIARVFASVVSSQQNMVISTPSPSYVTTASGGRPITSPWHYRLFWSRLDYLLGLNQEWLTCDQAAKRFEAESPDFDTRVTTLCQPITVDDNLPAMLRSK